MSLNFSAPACGQCINQYLFRSLEWVPFTNEGDLEPLKKCCNQDRRYFYERPVTKWVSLEDRIKLAETCKKLAIVHLETLFEHPSHLVLLSDQMHHICEKYDSIVGVELPSNGDADCLYQIATCYGQMFAYFIRIRCQRAIIYSDAACAAFTQAIQMRRNDPVRCLEISIACAKLLKENLDLHLDKPRGVLILALSHAEGANDVNVLSGKDYSKAEKKLKEFNVRVAQWQRGL